MGVGAASGGNSVVNYCRGRVMKSIALWLCSERASQAEQNRNKYTKKYIINRNDQNEREMGLDRLLLHSLVLECVCMWGLGSRLDAFSQAGWLTGRVFWTRVGLRAFGTMEAAAGWWLIFITIANSKWRGEKTQKVFSPPARYFVDWISDAVIVFVARPTCNVYREARWKMDSQRVDAERGWEENK